MQTFLELMIISTREAQVQCTLVVTEEGSASSSVVP